MLAPASLAHLPHPFVPAFGLVLTGLPAAAVILVGCAVFVLLVWATAQRKWFAWWGMLLLLQVMAVATIVTFVQQDFKRVYSAMGSSDEQIRFMRSMSFGKHMSSWAIWTLALLGTLSILYMLAIPRYFTQATASPVPREVGR